MTTSSTQRDALAAELQAFETALRTMQTTDQYLLWRAAWRQAYAAHAAHLRLLARYFQASGQPEVTPERWWERLRVRRHATRLLECYALAKQQSAANWQREQLIAS